MATINDRLLKEVEAGADEITCLKAVQRATADQCRQEKETADQREEQASQLGNALKAAENARAAEQESRRPGPPRRLTGGRRGITCWRPTRSAAKA